MLKALCDRGINMNCQVKLLMMAPDQEDISSIICQATQESCWSANQVVKSSWEDWSLKERKCESSLGPTPSVSEQSILNVKGQE